MNYLKYIYYIRTKDHTEYTGVESYISSQLKEEVVSSFNIENSLVPHQQGILPSRESSRR